MEASENEISVVITLVAVFLKSFHIGVRTIHEDHRTGSANSISNALAVFFISGLL
jgi:hypothetical protein